MRNNKDLIIEWYTRILEETYRMHTINLEVIIREHTKEEQIWKCKAQFEDEEGIRRAMREICMRENQREGASCTLVKERKCMEWATMCRRKAAVARPRRLCCWHQHRVARAPDRLHWAAGVIATSAFSPQSTSLQDYCRLLY